ncbi:MAG TPA: hypothetical protein VGU20_29215 [Stellaceae bacterium]|nr:hypothetical protein [Stellaceae bacterium]
MDARVKPAHDDGGWSRTRVAARRLALLILCILTPLPAFADAFVPGTEDVPLMAGLAPVAGSSVVFDKPEGRIVEAQAAGKVTRAAVRAFYEASLPRLGWSAAGADAWRREGEVLRLDYREERGLLTVGFTLSPQ